MQSGDASGCTRRAFLVGSSAVLGALALPAAWPVLAASWSLDFRRALPNAAVFRRPSAALVSDLDARLRRAAPDEPRRPMRGGEPLGVLLEGPGQNLLSGGRACLGPGWKAKSGVLAEWDATVEAPDGSRGALRLTRGTPAKGAEYLTSVEADGGGLLCASVWLRSAGGTGTWRLKLLDFETYANRTAVVELGSEWRRYVLPMEFVDRDSGAKRFSLIDNGPQKSDPKTRDIRFGDPYQPADTELTLDSAYAWGAQLERAQRATSFIAEGQRAADELTIPTEAFGGADRGRLSVELPLGGAPGATLLDAGAQLRLAYSNSGWLVAEIGGHRLMGVSDATADRKVVLQWSPDGAMLSSVSEAGKTRRHAAIRGAVAPGPLPARARLGTALDGSGGAGLTVAQLDFDAQLSPLVAVPPPAFVPNAYQLVFGDDFDDADLSRLNEDASGGSKSAPAWRSRYRHPRKNVINGEKQIYMDPRFGGSADEPLGVQPFSIANGVLTIRAERASPRVSRAIWGYEYTSGCITTELTHAQTYGYFEMCAQLPRGKGFWPAFWLLPKRDAWPPEIDVVEASGERPFSIHHGVIEKKAAPGASGAWIRDIADLTDGFHYYGCEWTEAKISFFVDGRKTFEYGPHGLHEDMYLLANLAVGSRDPSWIPEPDSSTPFPGEYRIDYIRAYQRR